MAWRCTGSSNAELIANLSSNNIFHSIRVANAMRSVDRANYVLNKSFAYEDSPQMIGHGATISAPHMHAYAAEHLLPYLIPGARVLDVGSGSGYLSAVFHHLVTPPADSEAPTDQQGKVIGIDHIQDLVSWSIRNLRNDGLGEALDRGHIEMITGDGRQGYPQGGPYNAIHVGAAAPVLPTALVDQLASPGRMFIPVGTIMQHIYQIDKDENGVVSQKQVMAVSYVPLTDRE